MAVIGVEIISPDSEGQRTAAVVVTLLSSKVLCERLVASLKSASYVDFRLAAI
jgi:hypothetical protein